MRYWLTARLHVSWIIMIWCLAAFFGIVIAASGQFAWTTSIGWLLTASALGLFACVRQQRWVVLLIILSGSMIGVWRGSIASNELSVFQSLIGQNIVLNGVVAEDVDRNKQGNVVVQLTNLEIDQRPIAGRMWVALDHKKVTIRRSDQVIVSGKLQTGFGTFAASMYQANLINAKRPAGADIALEARDWYSAAVRKVIVEPAASLGLGFLVGQRRDLPPELEESLRITGLTHIIVASGYNLTILVRISRRLFERISKYMAATVSAGLIIGFIAVTGASPSMARAGLVTGLALIAWYYGRTFHPFVLLALAIAITTLINPSYAWGDVGWQLSFAAFAGVIILAPIFQSYFFGDKKPGLFRQIVGETVAATICTLPILLVNFGYMSNVGLFANIVVVPFIPLAMLLVFFSGVFALTVPFIAIMIAVPTTWLLEYMLGVANILSNLDWAMTDISLALWQAGMMYVGIIIAGIYMWWQTRIDLAKTSVIE